MSVRTKMIEHQTKGKKTKKMAVAPKEKPIVNKMNPAKVGPDGY